MLNPAWGIKSSQHKWTRGENLATEGGAMLESLRMEKKANKKRGLYTKSRGF